MLWKIFMALSLAIAFMGLGALMALELCSRLRWCPRYLRRQLNDWRKRMEKQNEKRHRGKMQMPEQTTPPPDEAA